MSAPISPSQHTVTKIAVQGKRLVSGLFWQTLRKPRSYMVEARAIGKRENMDIVAIRQGSQILQAGFVSKTAGVGKGWYSFAAAAADYFSDEKNVGAEPARLPFIAAFSVAHDEYAMVAVKDGAILPGSDLVGTLAEVKALVRKFYQRIGKESTVTYLPPEVEWGESSINPTLADLIGSLKRAHTLRPLSFGGLTTKELAAIGSSVVLLVGVTAAAIQWRAYIQERDREAARLAKLRAEEIARQSGRATPVQALVHPWTTLPKIQTMLHACREEIYAAPLSVAGWLFEGALCKPASVLFTYRRAPGRTINGMQRHASAVWPASVTSFGANGDEATVSITIAPAAGGDDLLPSISMAADRFMSHFQYLQVSADMAEKKSLAPPKPLPGAQGAAPLPAPDWRTLEFQLSTLLPPFDLFDGLDGEGSRILEISTKRQNTSLAWSIKGEIYGK